MFAGVWARRCALGGLSMHAMDQAVNGVAADGKARVLMDECNVSHTGFFGGVAVRAHGGSLVTLRACCFLHNEYAVGVGTCVCRMLAYAVRMLAYAVQHTSACSFLHNEYAVGVGATATYV